MKLKLDENGHVVVSDGKPVYVQDDGKEVAFDVVGTAAAITRLNGEAKGHRERAEAAETKLKGFEGITDPALALKALETVKNLDDKKLIDAGEVDKVKTEVSKAYEVKLAEATKRSETLEQQLYSEKVGGSLARSKFISEKLAIPADIVESRFGKHFKVEDGHVVAYDDQNNRLYSPANPSQFASVDEALEIIVDRYPYKDTILKGQMSGGGGAGNGGAGGGAKTMKAAEFNALSPKDKAAKMSEGVTLVD